MFKERKIAKLQVEIARLTAEIEILERLVTGACDIPSYYVDKFIAKSGELATKKQQLTILN